MKKHIRILSVLFMILGMILLGSALIGRFPNTLSTQNIAASIVPKPISSQPITIMTEPAPTSQPPIAITVETATPWAPPISIVVQGNTTPVPVTITVESPVDPAKAMVALTFDDGPGLRTPEILKILRENDAKATFFLVGTMINANKDVLNQITAQGSEIGNHSWNHKSLSSYSYNNVVNDLEKTSQLIESISGTRPTLIRPPYGNLKGSVKKASTDMNLAIILWSIDTLDWKTRSSRATYDSILSQIKDGSIILCHDIHDSTVDTMYQVIPALKKMGYQLVTVSELLHYKYGGQKAGSVYYNGYDK